MVQIKLLDKPPFYYHEYYKRLNPKLDLFSDRKEYLKDEDGYLVFEQPDKSWCLPFEPAYIFTDEKWLIERILSYAKDAFEMVDIEGYNEEKTFFRAAIPQERLDLCIPPNTRKHENEPPAIDLKIKSPSICVYSDGNIDCEEDQS